MIVSLFGIKNAENKRAKIDCKSKFDIKTLKISPLLDKNDVCSGYLFQFTLSFKRGEIAFTILEVTLIDNSFNSKCIYIYPTFNEKINAYTGSIALSNHEKNQYKIHNTTVKLVNLCNDTSVFKSKSNEFLEINEVITLDLEKEKKSVAKKQR